MILFNFRKVIVDIIENFNFLGWRINVVVWYKKLWNLGLGLFLWIYDFEELIYKLLFVNRKSGKL